MNRNLDEQLHTMFKEHRNCELPEDIQITIDATLDNIKNSSRKKYLFSKILAGCAIFLFAFTVVFAKDIKNLANNIFNYQFNGNQGIQKAVDKGYIQNIDMDYIETNNIKFKVDYVTMDDSILAINFNFLLDRDASEYKGISFYNMKIYDDSNNMIYTEEEKYPNDGISLGIGISKTIFINENNLVQSFLIESDRFPKNKIIRITFDKIILYNENKGKPITQQIDGNFDITVQLDEKFYNRETVNYNIKPMQTNNIIDLSKVFLTETSLNFVFNNSDLNKLSIDIKNENGLVIYHGDDIYLREINDNTNRKIAKIDITKYQEIPTNFELNIITENSTTTSKNIYLYEFENENQNVYNINEISKGDENEKSVINVKFKLEMVK